MFKIADGREYFYQWDLDRQVIVDDPSIVEVHFCNRTDDCSLVTKVVDGRANVPNILLQTSFDIRVFGYDGKATLHDKKFKVNARTRPADYVYTETEVLSIKQLEEELRNDIDERLENIVDEVIENIPETKGEYYLDFSDATEDRKPATEEMIEFATRFLEGKNVCAHVKTIQNTPNAIAGWQPVTISKMAGTSIRLTTNGLAPDYIIAGVSVPYFCYRITNHSTKGWIYYREHVYRLTLATNEYVDNAIANLDIPEAEVDLSNYYTKDEVNDIITGGEVETEVTFMDDGAGNVSLMNVISFGTAEGGAY
jgi:hypothetical protein